MKYLQPLLRDIEVAPVLADLEANPWVWDKRQLRRYTEAHREVSDCWIRFNDWKNFNPAEGDEGLRRFVLEEHEAVWYPEGDALPNLKTLIFELACYFRCERLGTVLITRIPPGAQVKPHIDPGWAANFYEKIAVQLKSSPKQAFCYADGKFVCEPGTCYSFNNSHEHWVTNDDPALERQTLIICIRRDQRLKPLAHE
jgi:hypothetical protein